MDSDEAFGFHRNARGEIVIALDDTERQVIASLAEQLVQMVAPQPLGEDADPLAAMIGITEGAEFPDDPALGRLLPDAFVDDAAASAEFRRFTERDLRSAKQRRAAAVRDAVAAADAVIVVDVDSWLGFLNDLRLVLGERLGIQEEFDRDIPEDDDRAGWLNLYDWLTYLQESLVQLLLP